MRSLQYFQMTNPVQPIPLQSRAVNFNPLRPDPSSFIVPGKCFVCILQGHKVITLYMSNARGKYDPKNNEGIQVPWFVDDFDEMILFLTYNNEEYSFTDRNSLYEWYTTIFKPKLTEENVYDQRWKEWDTNIRTSLTIPQGAGTDPFYHCIKLGVTKTPSPSPERSAAPPPQTQGAPSTGPSSFRNSDKEMPVVAKKEAAISSKDNWASSKDDWNTKRASQDDQGDSWANWKTPKASQDAQGDSWASNRGRVYLAGFSSCLLFFHLLDK